MINGDGVNAIIEFDCEIFGSSFDDGVRSVVGRLQWFAHSIVAYEHMCSCG